MRSLDERLLSYAGKPPGFDTTGSTHGEFLQCPHPASVRLFRCTAVVGIRDHRTDRVRRGHTAATCQ